MTIRLKERLFEEKLNRFSDGCFSKRLNIAHTFKDIKSKRLYEVRFPLYLEGEKIHVNIIFEESDVEEVPEYTPNAWNNYPEVDPPEDVLMRVEYDFVEEDHEGNPLTTVRVYESGRYHRGHWFNANGDAELFCESFDEERVSNFRFRPWED